jgi:hypothetical protein
VPFKRSGVPLRALLVNSTLPLLVFKVMYRARGLDEPGAFC